MTLIILWELNLNYLIMCPSLKKKERNKKKSYITRLRVWETIDTIFYGVFLLKSNWNIVKAIKMKSHSWKTVYFQIKRSFLLGQIRFIFEIYL